MKWSLFLISDLHFESEMRNKERFSKVLINQLKQDNNLQLIVSAGDLTEKGYSFELKNFRNDFVNVIKETEVPLLLCGGNHDTYVKWPYLCKPVLKYIHKKYHTTWSYFNHNKSNCYKREYNGIEFISMGIYPKNLKWLRKNLPTFDKPVMIFFHYNIRNNESYADWWKEEEKDAFYEVIKNYNIIGLMHGHYHHTYARVWKNLPVFNGSAANGGLLLEFDDTKIITTKQVIKNR